MSQRNLGTTAGEPWTYEGDAVEPGLWCEFVEIDYLRPTSEQSANIAAALSVDPAHFANLVTWTHG